MPLLLWALRDKIHRRASSRSNPPLLLHRCFLVFKISHVSFYFQFQVKIGPDGKLVIDEASLVVQGTERKDTSAWDIVEEVSL